MIEPSMVKTELYLKAFQQHMALSQAYHQRLLLAAAQSRLWQEQRCMDEPVSPPPSPSLIPRLRKALQVFLHRTPSSHMQEVGPAQPPHLCPAPVVMASAWYVVDEDGIIHEYESVQAASIQPEEENDNE